jgi:NAD(P)-dependent dehydrogenase (short-subunit alcohol dehydrogenase family)
MSTFSDKVTLVTGATSGIGRAAALAFAREGAKVVVSGRRVQDGEATVALIRSAGGEATFAQTDVTDEEQVAALVKQTLSMYGRLDAAFNNAGIGEGAGARALIHEKTIETYHEVMNTNVLGVFLCLKHELAAMVKRGRGAIVNNASVSGLIGFPGASIYVASKHAVLGLTKSAALECAAHGIRVNAVAPGGTETPLLDRITGGAGSERHERFISYHPMGRTAQPDEIAAAVLWLCSDHASFTTGHCLAVDGGWTTQ